MSARFRKAPRPCAAAAPVLFWTMLAAGTLHSADAESRSLTLRAGERRTLTLDSQLDDTNFRDPAGYNHRRVQSRRFVQRVTVENTGPARIQHLTLIVNDHHWSTLDALRESLRLPQQPAALARGFYQFWKDHRMHAASGLEQQEDPLATLNFWGYTLCDHDTAALARFLQHSGIAARFVPLNGHVAGEYLIDGRWSVIDGDQNAVYLQLDNRTLASAEDLRADPLLVTRTKVFGKYAQMNSVHSRYNAALFEFVSPTTPKPLKPGRNAPDRIRGETLHPGEQLIFHYAEPPARAVGRANLDEWRGVREAALALTELVVNVRARNPEQGEVTIESAAPVVEAVNHTTGERFAPPAGELSFSAKVKLRSSDDRVSVFAQRAQIALPPFRKGENTVALRSTRGETRVTVEFQPHTQLELAQARVSNHEPEFRDSALRFQVQSSPGTDVLWWQIAADAQFTFIAPNFEAVTAAAEEIALDPLTLTVFNPGEQYHFRVRSRADGVWGEWSQPFAFQVHKPAPPAGAVVEPLEVGQVRLRWNPVENGAEVLVFGSNRLDFLPEIFAGEEIVRLEKLRVAESRPNRNQLAVTSASSAGVPAFRFYRLIARRGEQLSTPGPLLHAPAAVAANLPGARVLQMRARRVEDPQQPNRYRDEYIATEEELPHATSSAPAEL